MNQIETPESAALQSILRDNEIQTNRALALFLLLFIIYPFLNFVLLEFDESPNFSLINVNYLIPLSAVVFLLLLVVYLCRFNGSWVKNLLFIMVLACANIYFLFFPSYSGILVMIPFFVIIRYFNRRFVRTASFAAIGVFTAFCLLSLYLDKHSPVISQMHQMSYNNPWTYTPDVIAYILIPGVVASVFFYRYAENVSGSGHMLMKLQADNLCRISSMNAELSMASRIQKASLPSGDFTMENGSFSVHAIMNTAKEVGGDFYDYMLLRGNRIGVLIADVSDKGLSAALFMMSAKKALHCAAECCDTLDETIRLANRLICEDNQSGMFLTLWFALIDTHSGVGRYINAGHLPPYLCHPDGSAERLCNEPDLFLGNFPDMPPAVHSFKMNAGDTLFLYTDGVTDSMNSKGECFGTERLETVLRSPVSSPEMLCEKVEDASLKFASGTVQFDDTTVLLLHCRRLEEPETVSLEVPASTEGITKLQDELQLLLQKNSLPEEVKGNIGVVLDELAANIADYAYEGGEGSIRMNASVCGHCCDIALTDSGVPFDPLTEGLGLPDEPQIGGYGIFLARNLCSRLNYERLNNENVIKAQVVWGI